MSDPRVQEYRRLPYRRRVEKLDEEDGQYFVAFVEEIPWIRTFGDSGLDALYELDESFDDCILAMLEADDEIPRPTLWPESAGGDVPAPRRLWKRPGEISSRPPTITYRTVDEIEQWEPHDIEDGRELIVA